MGFEEPHPAQSLPPIQASDAYQRYAHRPPSEFAKLLYLVDRFWGTPYKVIYDGTAYETNLPKAQIMLYLLRNYKNETAMAWIQANIYRSEPCNNIVYIKNPGGKIQIARDLLLKELKALERLNAKK